MIRGFLLIYCSSIWIHFTYCDVSHLVFGSADPFYGFQPVFVSSSPRPLLPEITLNSANRGLGYQYYKPESTYLPPSPVPSFPPQSDVPVNGYLPPSHSVPLADPPSPPTTGYLPPVEQISENLEGIFPQNDSPQIVINIPSNGIKDNNIGYNYDRPISTTTPAPAPVFVPQADPIPTAPENNGGYNYEPPKAPSLEYLPASTEQRLAKGFDPSNDADKYSIQLQLNEMRCIPNQGGFFKTILTVQSPIYSAPVVDNDILDNRCDLRLVRAQIYINIAAEDFQRCGVGYCGTNMCLRIRFPVIRGMRTGEDSILTLQCKIQQRIVSKTHAVKVGVSNEYQARSVGALAQGGSQQPFRTQLEILRKTNNGFTKYLEPNGVVQLGEDLQLRAHARAGDGWNFTRLADVNMQRISSAGEIINSAALVNPSGCINPSMRSICPVPPLFEPPLGHRLTFKAVMFQGMRSGDEILMSVKIVGCMDQKDCYVNTLSCDRSALANARIRRFVGQMNSTEARENNRTEFSEISTIAFRVQLPESQSVTSESSLPMAHAVIGGILGFICLICLVVTLVYLKFLRKF